MLESFSDISEAETCLHQYLPKIQLIGQIPLTHDDVERINQYIRQKLGWHFQDNIYTVMKKTPTILACYLVWKGIENYNEGTYWNSIKGDLNQIDVNSQSLLGRFFIDFVKRNNLITVEIPEARRNITPILLHGIIPREMVPLFFSQIISPLIRRELVNPTDPTEIDHWINTKRKYVQQLDKGRHKGQELEDIERKIEKKEAKLIALLEQLASVSFQPEVEQKILDDIEEIETILQEEGSDQIDPEELNEALIQCANEFKIYSKLGFTHLYSEIQYPTFSDAIFKIIIKKLQKLLKSEKESERLEAKQALEFLYSSHMDGSFPLPIDIVNSINNLENNL